MRAEHTTRGGSTFTFTTGNYNITTQPSKEWSYVVADESGYRVECPDKTHGREIQPIDELMKKPLAIAAKLKEEEMIAVVLYTGVSELSLLIILQFMWKLADAAVVMFPFTFRSYVCHLQRHPPSIPSRHLPSLRNRRQHVPHHHFHSCERHSKTVPLHEHPRGHAPLSRPWRFHGAARHLFCAQPELHHAQRLRVL